MRRFVGEAVTKRYEVGVTRYALTHARSVYGSYGLRVLTFGAQGLYTYETREEAERALHLYEPDLRGVLGDGVADTLEVRAVECWPGHHDPKRTIIDEEPRDVVGGSDARDI